ncbi:MULTISPECIES: helix-turn-helix domain-containing protein [Pseudomonas syringae group]|uniref:PbsX family transcriptional regulator n=10 Tax=Pseudomonas syringae group TaxID=136849 RepID=A0A1S6YAD1_PSEAJ|nr:MULTISPECIES: helix-turn-helix transcriptional regulator [Pseudomonas syringae group]EGH43955.1 PbsX family transcriptional regulator [Pseudomonas syringae pv. pisi str. 1704B]AQX41791.1 PbsX family transcriptional regulator [Pseudomonas amygdali pv. tabaci]AVB12218.1 XRE family transcriptional regulator [Pseudomonas amygdali pv. morsprunorum]AVB23349.1 XRE family transcriptional regulator [Pseudomonas avellanae]EGH13467.1 PbsX family transcriptional regulator [Pseudomonas amygdali pv. mors
MKLLIFSGDTVDTLRSVVGAKIKALRKSTTLSQADLAEMIGCDAPLVSRYERGSTLPGIEQLIRIATVFNVAPGELLPGGQDVLRTRLLSLRQEITERIAEVDSPEYLEEMLNFINRYPQYDNKNKK